jgi:hypothetical protein
MQHPRNKLSEEMVVTEMRCVIGSPKITCRHSTGPFEADRIPLSTDNDRLIY